VSLGRSKKLGPSSENDRLARQHDYLQFYPIWPVAELNCANAVTAEMATNKAAMSVRMRKENMMVISAD
jgi:hypothetical protein